ncbi:hypothetical protein KW471_19295, partial [Vibrio fluvialis]|nr:hypothetical protein [Vibrio fluvialis]MBY7885940.1 hypothetical protein [Vibrio fluvialis]MBY7929023.1 hypothetical protein [Vibrio fluvialis]MBY8010413.1 hypothetical protein [Vibrio fluvialis]MBY8254947.1 hypothetical protein [Vibrio fluvialis]
FRTESASGTLGHSFTCHAMRCILTPLIRWPNSPYHYTLSVLDSVTGLPKIEKVVVLNHDDEPLSSDGKKVAFLSLEGNELRYVNKILKPVALLRPAYAARFQNTQSHYEGRIGVDFINLSI